ncbi:MAG: hypothetical protein WCE68_17340 [Anaerolineales bacterium]
MHTSRFAPRFVRSALIALAAILLVVTPALAYFAPSNGQAATLVLGQPNFTSSAYATTQTGMYDPYAVAVDPLTHKVFVAEYENNRVLRFASVSALSNGAPAEAVLGQTDFTSHAANATQSGMDAPIGVFVDAGGRLWVADDDNNRVLRFDHAASLPNGANASAVLGQPNFTSEIQNATQTGMDEPTNVFVDPGGRLWVADEDNNRVLRFDHAASKANGAKADGVLGQPNFTSNSYAVTRNGMWYPYGLVVDASGRLWVGDYSNNRVLRFDNAASKANGAKADGVLGQSNFTSYTSATTRNGMYGPASLAMDNATGRLYVADYENNRILVFNSAAGLPNGAAASTVLGQPDFTTGAPDYGGLSATSLYEPLGIFYDPANNVLWVADVGNNRVLMYGIVHFFRAASTAIYDGWVLESAVGSGVGGSFSTTGTLRVGDDASDRQYLSILSFNTSGLPVNAVIQSITLRILKAGKTGTDPLANNNFLSLYADVKKGSFGAPALEAGDFQALSTHSQVGSFSSTGGGWYQMVLPTYTYSDFTQTSLTQFRLYFERPTNYNHKADYDSFFAGDASAGDRPVLTITYTLGD